MRMWDWKAGNWQGITDSEARALARAESRLPIGANARVELAISSCGALYKLGVGWTATRTEAGALDWVPLQHEAAVS